MNVQADPKQGKRIIDPSVAKLLLRLWPECAACEAPATNAHHIIPKGSPYFGDDVYSNEVPICGSGTSRCHGAFHGNPYEVYTDRWMTFERRDAAWVSRRIGEHIAGFRPDVIEYVLQKLGADAGSLYLNRIYYLEV